MDNEHCDSVDDEKLHVALHTVLMTYSILPGKYGIGSFTQSNVLTQSGLVPKVGNKCAY